MKKPFRKPSADEQALLDQLRVRPITPQEWPRFKRLLAQHHYLGAPKAVGERLAYVAQAHDRWLALFYFNAAAKHLRARDGWIGWSPHQCRRRLSLVANNSRFLILPDAHLPNLATRALRLCLDRLSPDWQARYGHPILLVETFVDPARFCGTTYTIGGWIEQGRTAGFRRCARDYYVAHDQPKRLFVRELQSNARRTLAAEALPPALAAVEAKTPPWPTQSSAALRSLAAHFEQVADWRVRIENYPLSALLAIGAAAHLCGAPRGQRDLAAFARRLTQAQRRALRIRRDRSGRYPAPSKATFTRALARVPAGAVEEALRAFQMQVRGPAPASELVVLDGKAARSSRGQQLLTAVTVPGQHYLGSQRIETKSNEIPAARELIGRLDLEGRLVALDALHTQSETARLIVQEAGADYLLTVKDNQKGLRESLRGLLPPEPAAIPPSA